MEAEHFYTANFERQVQLAGHKLYMTDAPSCSLYAIMARESPWAVIFRRGPSRFVQLIRWHTENDEFEHGQWFKGRIYERAADLSPSGDKLIYLSTNWRQKHPHYGPYIVISRPPFLTALAIFETCGTRDGCGFFQTGKLVRMASGPLYVTENTFKTEPPSDLEFSPLPQGVYFRERQALHLAGWLPVKEQGDGTKPVEFFTRPEISIKTSPSNPNMQLFMHNVGHPIADHTTLRYYLHDIQSGFELDLGILDWCDFDKAGDLVFSEEGCLYRLKQTDAPAIAFDLTQAKLLYDFRPSQFTELKAPSWALEWD